MEIIERDKTMNGFKEKNLNSGSGIVQYLDQAGVAIKGTYQLDGNDNVIRLYDLTTFNWKATPQMIRVNCKKPTKDIIESFTGLQSFDNGVGDPTRPYSFWIRNPHELDMVIEALKTIEKNRKYIEMEIIYD